MRFIIFHECVARRGYYYLQSWLPARNTILYTRSRERAKIASIIVSWQNNINHTLSAKIATACEPNYMRPCWERAAFSFLSPAPQPLWRLWREVHYIAHGVQWNYIMCSCRTISTRTHVQSHAKRKPTLSQLLCARLLLAHQFICWGKGRRLPVIP